MTCGTRNPDHFSPEEIEFALQAQERAYKTTGIVKVIPVAVHVIYSIEPNDPHNISLAQINSQIDQLNADFAGQSGGVDTEIQFCLAGVNRLLLPNLIDIESTTNAAILKDSVQSDPNVFLNVWVVNTVTESGAYVYGYSTYPQQLATAPQLDGIVVRSYFFGTSGVIAYGDDYNMGRTMVHEVGHWLSLLHVFQDGCDDASNCAIAGDCCCDTPPQEMEVRKCPPFKNSCHDDSPDKRDPIHNFMGYTKDDCRTEFTECQKARMHLCLDSLRPSAWFPQGGDCPQFRRAAAAQRDLHLTAYPNPFAQSTTLQLTLTGKAAPVTVTVIDAHGRQVATLLAAQPLGAGIHEVQFEAPAPGIYLVQASNPWVRTTLKLVATCR